MSGFPGASAAPSVVHMKPVDEEEQELLRNFGEHALMSRVQGALRAQLEQALRRADEELRSQEEQREAARKAREDIGVELYGVQQQLARVHADLDSKSTSVAALQESRAGREAELRSAQSVYASRKAGVDSQRATLEKTRGQLDGLLDTVRQVEKYNAEAAAELALAQRATSKAEEDTLAKEKAKAAQDEYIDSLSGKVKAAADQLALLQGQVDAQRAETTTASAMMHEAATEMETIRFEKQQLMLQWQSSLVAMRRRDEVLLATRKAISEAQAEVDGMDAEDGNVRKALGEAQTVHARLQDQLDKEKADLAYLQSQMDGLRRQFSALEEREEALTGQLDATDAEVRRLLVEQARLVRAVREADYQRQLVDKKRFEFEDEISEALNGKIANEKATKSLLRDAGKLVERARELSTQRAETENAIAASKVDALNLASQLSGLREQLAARETDVTDKEKIVAQYEVEIRQRTDAIDKKMAIVDRLNRKWEKMVASTPEAENMGPLQAEVHNLAKNIASVREACEGSQRRWLADQTLLVAATTDAEVKTTQLRENTSQAVLLNQKRVRLDAAIAGHRTELRRLEAGVKTMHDDMARINALMAKNDGLGKKLAGAAYTAERAFGEELKDLERESASQDARIASLEEERARLLGDLIEAERQAVLWEKKIQLEKETQEALDPSAGAEELNGMEKEVNRMRARYETLKRDQERLVVEMERSIEKRDVIATKHRSARQLTLDAAAAVGRGKANMAGGGKTTTGGAGKASGTLGGGNGAGGTKASEGGALTRAGLQQRAATLREDIATKLAQAEELDAVLRARMDEAARFSGEASERAEEVGELEAAAGGLQRTISAGLYEKQKAIETLQGLARMLQRFEALEGGKMPGLTSDEAARVRDRLREAEGARDAIRVIIESIAAQHVELAEILERVASLTETAPM
jgi:coiled-coil domain-containing protein 40